MDLLNILRDNWVIVLAAAFGLGAIYLLLPRPQRYPALWGSGAAAAAILSLIIGGVVVQQRDGGGTTSDIGIETFLFYLFSSLALLSGGALVTNRQPARAALSFTLVVLSTCGLFLLLAAPFLAAATIIVYAGAIIVTFLFVLMLVQQTSLTDADARSREPALSTITGFVLLVALCAVLKLTYDRPKQSQSSPVVSFEEIRPFANDLRAALTDVGNLNGEEEAPTAEQLKALVATHAPRIEAVKKWWDETSSSDSWDEWLKSLDPERQVRYAGTSNLSAKLFNVQSDLQTLNRDVVQLGEDSRALQAAEANKDDAEQIKELREAFDATREEISEGLAKTENDLEAALALTDWIEADAFAGRNAAQMRPAVQRLIDPAVEGTGNEPRDWKGRKYRTERLDGLSEMSGPSPARGAGEIRRDAHGRAQLPANNTGYVGRSLFSDYLLAVELGGLLLLVATVGAIVIAMRKPEHADSDQSQGDPS